LSREILSNFGGLEGFLQAPTTSLLHFSGIGKAKVANLLAVKELSNRFKLSNIQITEKQARADFQAISELLYFKMIGETRECFYLVMFGANEKLIQVELLSRGGLEEVGVYPREIAKISLDYGAKSIIISHNHPNSNALPSREDVTLFETLKSILKPLEIKVLDQLTIGTNGVYSTQRQEYLRAD